MTDLNAGSVLLPVIEEDSPSQTQNTQHKPDPQPRRKIVASASDAQEQELTHEVKL